MHVVPTDLDHLLEQQSANIQSEPPPAGWWSIWKGPKAVRHMICVHLSWSIYIVVYYGMLLNIRAFSREHLEINTVIAGQFHLNLKYLICSKQTICMFGITGVSEIAGVFIGLLLILHTTRKWLWTGAFNVIAGCFAYTAWAIPASSNIKLTKNFALIFKSCIFFCFLL